VLILIFLTDSSIIDMHVTTNN